ncbi:MAG TPA: hypothetical protein VJ953_18170 [Saprospiraceae bacterium]|nr:hypothetical protein [Saprospiraceae bacterium]
MRRNLILLIAFLSFSCVTIYAQVAQVQFGKNRVQYHDFFDEWSQYESENFITYWYGRSRSVGQAVVQMAEYDFIEIQSLLEHRINQKVQIIVYTDLSDVKQSNIGTEEVFTNTGGQTKIVDNRIFVYFDGNHNHLRKQIREGITEVYLNAMLFGANIQEIVQNAVMLNLPVWFKSGLVNFVGQRWNTDLDGQLKDIMLSEEYENFEELTYDHPVLAGHSFWYFVSESYGLSIVPQLLYLIRINRSIESGLMFSLGNSFASIAQEWERFYEQRYEADQLGRESITGTPVPIKNKKELPISTVKLSPDGTKLIYALNNQGKYKIYLQDLSSNERRLIKKGGFKNQFQITDYNYPIIAWNPNGAELVIISESRDKLKLETYDLVKKSFDERILPPRFQRIYSADFIDPFNLVFTVAYSGFSDIFTYQTRTQQIERITNDYHDDLDAVAATINGEKGILFVSNRPDTLLENRGLDTILPINTFDVFFYNMSRDIKELVRVSNTPYANERHPMAVNDQYFSYLSNQSGIYNRKMARLEDYVHHYDQKIILEDGTDIIMHADSSLESLDTSLIDTIELIPIIRQRSLAHTNTNYISNISKQHSKAGNSNRFVEAIQDPNGEEVYIRELQPELRKAPPFTVFQKDRIRRLTGNLPVEEEEEEAPPSSAVIKEIDDEPTRLITIQEPETVQDTIDPMDFYFQSEFANPPKKEARASNERFIRQSEEGNRRPVSLIEFLRSGADERNMHEFRPANIVPYELQFRTNYFSTQLDNSLLFEGLDNFAANPQGVFGYPPAGILLKANVKDLLEDHVFEGGVRVPTTFNGAEYFLTYENRKYRLDRIYSFYMNRERINQGSIGFVPRRQENVVMLGQYGLRYPLDIFQSLRARATLRSDRLTQLISDAQASNVPTQTATRAGIRLEYVYDNTMERGLNVRHGTRLKAFGEVYKKFNLNAEDGVSLSFSNGAMTIFSLDARHYEPILKKSIFAVRLSAATSFGSERIQYFLGGTDNWLLPQYNTDIPTTGANYAFQTAAPNIRGFRFGIRNGNSYALANTELRIPVFQYFSKNITSSFLRNFQLVGFFDVGTAWEGSDPYREDNPLNTTVFEEGEIIDVTVNYFRDPVVAGYGIGARSTLFGYYIRADYGWGIETGIVQDPRLHISMGLDF